MEFIDVEIQNESLITEIFTSYCNTFPEDERRSERQYYQLFFDEKAKVSAILNEEKLMIGYIIGWALSDFFFLEHFEVFPEFRNQNYGTEILNELFQKYSQVILESEPAHLNEMAERRIAFYTRNGLQIIDKAYSQPPYDATKKSVNLWLLANYSPKSNVAVTNEIFDVVYAVS